MKLNKLEHRSLWYKKIYYYLHAGQSLSDAARHAASDFDTRYIHQELSGGVSLSSIFAMKNFKKYFSSTEISLVRVAEDTGSIKEVFYSLSLMLKAQHLQKQKLIAATIYPGLVLLMSFGLLTMILTIIVPKISPLFVGMSELPIATKILIDLSDHVTTDWYVDIIIFIFIYIIHLKLKKNIKYLCFFIKIKNYLYQRFIYIKDIYLLWYIERWMGVMHLSLASNVNLADSLLYASKSIDDENIRKHFLQIHELVLQGNNCSDSIDALPKYLHTKIQDWMSVISSGEKTGFLKEVFQISHTHVQENLLEAIDRFQKIIEPVLIIFVGVMVLSICLSIILPMYQLTQSLQ